MTPLAFKHTKWPWHLPYFDAPLYKRDSLASNVRTRKLRHGEVWKITREGEIIRVTREA